MDVITPMLPMMGTMEFICGACVGAFVATCILTTSFITDARKNSR